MKTLVRWYSANNELEDSITLKDEDATTEAIARAVIEMVSFRMSMSAGDMIEVVEET